MTDPPVTDPNSYRVFVPSPPVTDPETWKKAFVIYVGTKVARAIMRFPLPLVAPIPEVQTYQLYTCSIGSFNIYATVDSVDCSAQTAILNIWMFNAMSKKSFGKFADDPAFAACTLEKQYMWWNWKEGDSWGPNPAPTPPAPKGSGGW
jgi:hypothetical protein